jgi:hypothetical protein
MRLTHARAFGVHQYFAAMIVGAALAIWPTAAAATPWLFVTDIHLDPVARDPAPSRFGFDANWPLLTSAINEMKRVAPAPPVVIVDGDFLAHNFDYKRAVPTMKAIAARFNAAFPKAQFVIALGNEDSGCGDYEITAQSPFLRGVAQAWEPLVNRGGAAPTFVSSFSRDGFYIAKLPRPHLRAIVIDDVFWSPRYHAGCFGTDADGRILADLRTALHDSSHDRSWVVAHIPPGIDAYSTTHVVHKLAVIPFLDPNPRHAWTQLIDDPHAHVIVALAAHTHKFAYRFDEEAGSAAVPFLLLPSISPIFHNAPAFLTVDVLPDGTIGDAEIHALLDDTWQNIGGTRSLGLSAFTLPQLEALQQRLSSQTALLERFARLYNAGARPEFGAKNWRYYWCAATKFSVAPYDACVGRGEGLSLLTHRGLIVAAGALSIAAVALLVVVLVMRHLRRRRLARRL